MARNVFLTQPLNNGRYINTDISKGKSICKNLPGLQNWVLKGNVPVAASYITHKQ